MSSGPAVGPSNAVSRPHNACKDDLTSLKDDQLLNRFFQEREDAAFAVLVERYGPLVYGVCRRILYDSNDAEDAFQATFLVLVRKGGTLRDPGRLANWLYGVAHRTARKLRAKAALRTKSERQAGEMPTKSDLADMTYEELQAILDEWTSGNSYSNRVNNIRNGTGANGAFVLDDTTVFDDGVIDTLIGDGGLDWFWRGTNDRIKDRGRNERVN